MMQKLKVIQWGTGYIGGEFSLRYILGNPGLELVGIKCFTEGKEGLHAGEFCGKGKVGPIATRNVEQILALDADCVLFMARDQLSDPSLTDSPSQFWVKDMVALLETGKNVITPICPGTHWRHLARGEEFRDKLNAACKKGNSTVHFSGFDPGFTTDALAYTLSSVAGEITQIRTWEIIDTSTYTALDSLRALGLGVKPEDVPPGGAEAVVVGWGGALHILGEAFGVVIEDTKFDFDIYLSPKHVVTPGGLEVTEGSISAIKWSLTGIVSGKPLFSICHVTRAYDEAAPDWPRIGRDGGYRVEMDSFPPFLGDFPMGLPGGTGSTFADAMAMTAARCVNSVARVVEARPGYLTFLDLPPLGGSRGSLVL